MLSGGPSSVYDEDAPHADKKVLELGVPVLGICYGLQFMVYALGGKVRPAEKREYGHATVERVAESRLFEGVPKILSVWMSHGDSAEELPPGFCLTAKTANAVAAVENAERKMWAVQFHPEVHHTPLGADPNFGTIAPRIQLDFLPALACASHILLKPRHKQITLYDHLAAGIALQRLWLTASSLGLHLQPEMTPVIFRWYVQADRKISEKSEINAGAIKLARQFEQLTSAQPDTGFSFFCRVGQSKPPHSRSLRKEISELMTN